MSTGQGSDPFRRRRLRERLRRLRPAGLLPQETQAHLWYAGREQLLAVRSLLDTLIARLEPEKEERP
ncbi:MAG: hypothetical protein HY689_09260 [Chloroflexi bacterium]|nr:hypothetical protein [Chloroflexota bacterium]